MAEPSARIRSATANASQFEGSASPPRPHRGGLSPRSPPVAALHAISSTPVEGGGNSSPRGSRRARANTLTLRTPPSLSPLPHDAIYDSIHLYTVRSQRGGLRERSRLNKTISKLARNELTRRTSVSLKAAIRPNREGHIFDYFCVVGYPPTAKVDIKASAESRRQEPVILYQYPEDNGLNEQVVHFCFPNGVTPTVSLRKKSAAQKSSTLELANCSLKDLKDSERSFLFLMTGNGALLYGICVSQNEILSCLEKPSFFKQAAYNPPSPLSPTELRYEVSAPRVYCLLSRFPFFKLHFRVLYTLLETERAVQKEALARMRQQAGIKAAEAAAESSSSGGGRANSLSSDADAIGKPDEAAATSSSSEKEKKGSAWNWGRWRWGKDKKDSKECKSSASAATDTDQPDTPGKMQRTSSAHSLKNWGLKRPGDAAADEGSKDDINTRSSAKAESSSSITTALISPRRGRATSRGPALDKSAADIITAGEATSPRGTAATEVSPRGRALGSKSGSEGTMTSAAVSTGNVAARKRSNSRVRSLFALGSNKIERGEIVTTDPDQPEAGSDDASPFPGIRLHQNAAEAGGEAGAPFPGIRLHMGADEATPPTQQGNGDATSATDDLPSDLKQADAKEKNKVVALLEAYYNTNIRSSLGSFNVKLPSAKRQGKFVCPEGDEEKLIMEWCAPTMLRLVPLPNIIVLLRALLQEYKVVLLCKNLGVLSFIAMALLPLLRPFEWQGPFIPLVPKNLEECVESPVPCVLGMPTTCEEDLIPVVMDDCLIVNIETEQVVLPERPLPPLPHEEELYAQLGAFHSKIYRPVQSPDRAKAFHRLAKSTKEEMVATAGFLNHLRSYQERLVQEVVNYVHIHCIAESAPAPSLPALPSGLAAGSPALSFPCLPTTSSGSPSTSPVITNSPLGTAQGYATSPLASSASYTSLTTFEQAELEATLAQAYVEQRTAGYFRPPPSALLSTSPSLGSHSMALPVIREMVEDHGEGDTNGRPRPVMDDHELWARTRSVVGASASKPAASTSSTPTTTPTKTTATTDDAMSRKDSGGIAGRRNKADMAAALIQTLPHNRELEDIKAQVEIDRVSSDEMIGGGGKFQVPKATTPRKIEGKRAKNDDDGRRRKSDDTSDEDEFEPEEEKEDEDEGNESGASSQAHPLRTARNLSFSASAIPAFVASPSTSPEAGSKLLQQQQQPPTLDSTSTDARKNESESEAGNGSGGPGRRKLAIPMLPIRVRAATSSSSSSSDDQQPQPGSASPPPSPKPVPRGADADVSGGPPPLILSLRPSVPPLASPLPQLVASVFDWTDIRNLRKIVCLFPVTQQKFIANFLSTQHFTMFTERLAKIFGSASGGATSPDGRLSVNVVTPRAAARFLDQLKKMIEQEESQATMARSLLQIYTMLEAQQEVVGFGGGSESDHSATSSPALESHHPHERLAVPSPQGRKVLGTDFGMGKVVREVLKHSGSNVGVRGEAGGPSSASPAGTIPPSPMSSPTPLPMSAAAAKRPGHRRQGSVGGQEILKIKPEEEIEGEVGKEQKNMEQIIKLSDERLRILTRSKETLKALFSSDSPQATSATNLMPTSTSASTVASVVSPRSRAHGPIPSGFSSLSTSPSPSSSLSSLATSTSKTRKASSPRGAGAKPAIVVSTPRDNNGGDAGDAEVPVLGKGSHGKKIRGRASRGKTASASAEDDDASTDADAHRLQHSLDATP